MYLIQYHTFPSFCYSPSWTAEILSLNLSSKLPAPSNRLLSKPPSLVSLAWINPRTCPFRSISVSFSFWQTRTPSTPWPFHTLLPNRYRKTNRAVAYAVVHERIVTRNLAPPSKARCSWSLMCHFESRQKQTVSFVRYTRLTSWVSFLIIWDMVQCCFFAALTLSRNRLGESGVLHLTKHSLAYQHRIMHQQSHKSMTAVTDHPSRTTVHDTSSPLLRIAISLIVTHPTGSFIPELMRMPQIMETGRFGSIHIV